MSTQVMGFEETGKSANLVVGGKGANLGELSRIDSIKVPDGFCITTEAYKKLTENNQEFSCLLDELTHLKVNDRLSINKISEEIRTIIENITFPEDIAREVEVYLSRFADQEAFAVRSSATAEDLPTASFAGQQDSFLNVIGKTAILKHISKCWASLFTDRAVTYRIQNGFDHQKVQLAVVVQQMVFPQVAGILFTADPISGNRKTLSIDASFGLGEAMVSGLVNADNYQVRDSVITDKKISAKKLAIYALKDGGTKAVGLSTAQQNRQALTDEQILQLEQLGRKIEAHFGNPQDIEWCLVEDSSPANGYTFYIVQSRPITTLYPIPTRPGATIGSDKENHVYISVGHQQMMTDPMKPLGLSLWQFRAARPMFEAGGRLFVDVTDSLVTARGKANLLEAMEQHDPLIKDALVTITERGDFIKVLPDEEKTPVLVKSTKGLSAADILAQLVHDPTIVANLIKESEASVTLLKQNIQTKSGTDLFDFIVDDIAQSKKMIFDSQHMGVIIAAMNASSWLNDQMGEWLGEKNVADVLSQSVSNNITSEMGLALLDVADVIRPYPEVVKYLQQIKTDNFLDELLQLAGGKETRDAIEAFLDQYGMRCAGEIDITNTRWSEKPSILIPIILSNIKNFEAKAGKRKFEQGLNEVSKKEKALLDALALLPDGAQKAIETKQMIGLLRNFAGYREYPKYGIVNRFFVYKQALLKEVEKLLQAKVIEERDDAYYLTFEELREVVLRHKLDLTLIGKRKEEHCLFEKLNPPRVITSYGEIVAGKYKHKDLPAGAIAGLAVSSGLIEGRARVILNMADANLEEGDILVTTFTDPSWTPLFVSIKGLVTEVGGLMTHGAVIAREYGLPAVVGLENATKLIKDGQRIRVNGTDGYVEML
jgi:phosphoenolpyruvate synthase/pyruvate phosphate dikinase